MAKASRCLVENSACGNKHCRLGNKHCPTYHITMPTTLPYCLMYHGQSHAVSCDHNNKPTESCDHNNNPTESCDHSKSPTVSCNHSNSPTVSCDLCYIYICVCNHDNHGKQRIRVPLIPAILKSSSNCTVFSRNGSALSVSRT